MAPIAMHTSLADSAPISAGSCSTAAATRTTRPSGTFSTASSAIGRCARRASNAAPATWHGCYMRHGRYSVARSDGDAHARQVRTLDPNNADLFYVPTFGYYGPASNVGTDGPKAPRLRRDCAERCVLYVEDRDDSRAHPMRTICAPRRSWRSLTSARGTADSGSATAGAITSSSQRSTRARTTGAGPQTRRS